MTQVKRYDIFDIRLQAKAGKPFDTPMKARLAAPDGTRITVWGFYDGGDRFLIRFMPEQEGNYTYETLSPVPAMHGITGSFQCTGVDGHGKVMPDGLYLKHADGTRHFSAETTCYAWIYQPQAVRADTIAEFEKGYFNKLRMQGSTRSIAARDGRKRGKQGKEVPTLLFGQFPPPRKLPSACQGQRP